MIKLQKNETGQIETQRCIKGVVDDRISQTVALAQGTLFSKMHKLKISSS